MSSKCHQHRWHHIRHQPRRRRLRLFASMMCIMMSFPKTATALSSASLRVTRGGFVARQRYNGRRLNTISSKIYPEYHQPIKSMQTLHSAGDSTEQDTMRVNVQVKSTEEEKGNFHCYLLRSLDPEHPLKTYIGFTTEPWRRLRQQNGELVGGARRTKSGRPWEFVAVIGSFQDKVTAMQFEWAWQHTGRSKVFREAVGCDKLARKMKRRRGVKARLDELGILLNDCPPFNTFPLTVYFHNVGYHELFADLPRNETRNSMNLEVCSVDAMPFAKRKSTRRERARTKAVNTMGNSLNMNIFGSSLESRQWINAISSRWNFPPSRASINCNPLFSLGARPKTSWALNSIAEASVQESQSDNRESAEQNDAVKVPAKFRPYPFMYHQELTMRIESLTNLGFGVARIELEETMDKDTTTSETEDCVNGEGKKWVVFIPNVIPGEIVRVRIYRNYASYSDADLLQIIEPSPDRIEPKCSLATICGGCQYQHISIDRQRKMKTMQVQELFERLGAFETHEFPAVLDTLGTEKIFGYRSKITPHYDAPMTKKEWRKAQTNAQNSGDAEVNKSCEIGPIGFKEKASRRLVDVPYCHIATPAINDALVNIRDSKREEARQGLLKKPSKGATLLLRDADGVVETDHNVYVNTTVNNLTFRFQAGNFFQNNPFMLSKMVDLVVEASTRASSSGKPMTHLIDCYCGSGLFAIGSSSSFDVCVGIEVNEKAVEEARENAALNGIQNCDFVSASAEAIFQSENPVRVTKKDADGNDEDNEILVRDFPRKSTVVVVDPPRKGCSEEFLEQLNQYKPQRVVYVSCDPATQARDAKLLVSYGYEIVSIQPFDLFPQTRHIECLAVFERVATN